MENPPLPDPSNPDTWSPPQLAQATEQLHKAIEAGTRNRESVNYLAILKQYCEHRLLTITKR